MYDRTEIAKEIRTKYWSGKPFKMLIRGTTYCMSFGLFDLHSTDYLGKKVTGKEISERYPER